MREAKAIDGSFLIDGSKTILLCADYPYYRDSAENWKDRLEKLKNLNINVITCYIPWRHHLVNFSSDTYDFEGKNRESANLLLFLEECEKCGLYVMIKPGPFIHAEVNYGGLPDELNSPEFEKKADLSGAACEYEKKEGCYYLPTSFSETFMKASEKWYEKVLKAVERHLYPAGCIIGIQLMNEGVFSDANSLIEDWDYSKSALERFSVFLEKKYGSVDVPNSREVLTRLPFRNDWIEFQYKSFYETYRRFREKCPAGIPVIANYNFPVSSKKGLSAWMAKVRPEQAPDIMYGYTSWGGNMIQNKDRFYTYLLVAKRRKGMHMECNWGFSKLYEKEYEAAIVPFYEAALSIANGSAGYNIYTGVATSVWEDCLDNVYDRPYPDFSPIDCCGNYDQKKCPTIAGFNSYLGKYGKEIADCRLGNECAYLFDPADFYDGCFEEDSENPALDSLYWFQHNMRAHSYDYDLVNMETADGELLSGYKAVFAPVRKKMPEKSRKILDDYVTGGGCIIYFGEVPEEIKAKNVSRIGKAYELKVGNGKELYLGWDGKYDAGQYTEEFREVLEETGAVFDVFSGDYETQAWSLQNTDGKTRHVFVFSRAAVSKEHKVMVRYQDKVHTLQVRLPQESAAVIRFADNQVKGFFVKGENDLVSETVKAKIVYGDYVFESKEDGDCIRLE